MSNVISLVDYADRLKQAEINANYAEVVKEFTDTVDHTVKFLDDILRDGVIEPASYSRFSSSNARVTDIIGRINDKMLQSPQRDFYAKQKARYKFVCIAIIGCYTASMY